MTFTNYSDAEDQKAHVFSTFLKKIRSNNSISQEQLCLQLRQHSSLFYNLDSITVSRWERGVNIPSLTKQAKIVELYDDELTSIYSDDKQFIRESSELIMETDPINQKSNHPYFRNDNYQIHTIDIDDESFYLVLKMIMRYEGNPTINFELPLEMLDRLGDLKITIATAFNGQIIGHCLFLTSTTKATLELVNFTTNLENIIKKNIHNESQHNTMLVLSSAGATKQVENSIMSTYINKFSEQKQLRFMCFSTSNGSLIKKLNKAKLEPFKVKNIELLQKTVQVSSYIITRSEVMANRFLLKLAVITPMQLNDFLTSVGKGKNI